MGILVKDKLPAGEPREPFETQDAKDKAQTHPDKGSPDTDQPAGAEQQPAADAGFEGNWDVGSGVGPMRGDPEVDYYKGGTVTAGPIDDGGAQAVTREVTDPELVQNQLSGLLRSDSKYMQDARRQGLEQANAMGGLGGTVGTGASMTSALRAALPIAQQDAATFTKVASENMAALNQFAQLNHQRATQLALGEMDSNTRIMTANISASSNLAIQKLQNAAQRDIALLDSQTKIQVTELQGAIQARLAKNQFRYDQILQDERNAAMLANTQLQGEYGLAGTQLQGEWEMRRTEELNRMQRETNFTTQHTALYDGYLNRIAELNGMEMDDAARERAIATITEGYKAAVNLLNSLYPDLDPITMGG